MAGSYRDSPLPTGRIGSLDPHGAAALLLVESLIHSLMAQAMLRTDDVLSIVQVAIDAQIELNDERGDDSTEDSAAVQLLSRIKATFEIDGTS